MKLATLKSDTRDGRLAVVDSTLSNAVYVPEIAATLQDALENWLVVHPRLEAVSRALATGNLPGRFAFDPARVASPLPRAYQFLDGSVYLFHMERARKARGAEMPPNYKTEPLMYQGLSDCFIGPRAPFRLLTDEDGIDYEPEVAVIVDDVPMGVSVENAASHIRLVMLLNDFTLRHLTRTELPKGFGFLQAKPTSSFSPVAVTLDELGDAWDGEKLSLPIVSTVNGRPMGCANAGVDMFFTYPQLIAHAARTRALSAGTIIGAGAISNRDPATGHACLAEARAEEELEHGAAHTPWLRFGDTVRIDMFDAAGRTLFGAIEQTIERA